MAVYVHCSRNHHLGSQSRLFVSIIHSYYIFLHLDGNWLHGAHLKASHVSGVPGVFQAVLIALEEEFQKESVGKTIRERKDNQSSCEQTRQTQPRTDQ